MPYGFFFVSVAFNVILMITETECETDHHWSSSMIASEYDSDAVCSNQNWNKTSDDILEYYKNRTTAGYEFICHHFWVSPVRKLIETKNV